MVNFIDYFNDDDIVKLLCSYRAQYAHQRHKLHMMRDISLTKSTNKIESSQNDLVFTELQSIFPSRRNWAVLNRNERIKYSDSIKRNKNRLFKSYLIYKNMQLPLNQCESWYQNLKRFIDEIKSSILEIDHFSFNKPEIMAIIKKNKPILPEYRPIALYGIRDRIISSLTAKYLIDSFDEFFLDCSFAFRSAKNTIKFSHHLAVEKIMKYRNHSKSIWVSECDIEKFFDTVNHSHVTNVFKEYIKQLYESSNVKIDNRAILIFENFLKSYCFKEDVFSKNGDSNWWERKNIKEGEFKWVEESLKKKFGEYYLSERIGIPQGNAISCFVSNLLLHNVDLKVQNANKDIFYVRFCDDMILMHNSKSVCTLALEVYKKELTNNFLIFHSPVRCDNYLDKVNRKLFWKSKSKEPYYWGNPNLDKFNIPWLSFVGYQINYNGKLRIRKKSLNKEKKKQVQQVENVLSAIESKRGDINVNSRLSKKQIIYSLTQRLNSMSIGRVELYNYKNPKSGLCWVNGFNLIKQNKNPYLSKQLKELDRSKEQQIWRLKQNLSGLSKRSYKPEKKDNENIEYFGSPFSYFNYLNDY